MSIKFNYRILVLSSVPILNGISDITAHFFSSGLHTGHVRGVILIFLFVLGYTKYKNILTNHLILCLTAYLFILVLFSQNLTGSFDIYLKFITSINMFLFGYNFLYNKEDFKKVFNAILLTFSLIIFYLASAQVIPGLGEASYSNVYLPAMGDGSGTGVYVLNSLAYYSLLLPLAFYEIDFSKFKKLLFLIITLATLVLLVLVFRRSALLAYVLGLSLIFLFNFKNRKFAGFFIVIIALVVVFSPILYENFLIRLEERGGVEVMTSDTYSRGYDLQMAWEVFKEGSAREIMIGDYSQIFKHTRIGWILPWRQVHNDFAAIFLGSGLVGLLLFILIHYSILRYNYRIFKNYKYRWRKVLFGTILALLLATTIQSFANQYWTISSLSTVFFLLGILTKYNLILKKNFKIGNDKA
ncbi:O-antigen ligase family protein [Cyclobacterium sp. SYSU L10401]|uniref:O-antigen ligase family protein n=1 Tax=Cyclobacterium sp. SYSU L10401 TaxID=2678657 RepID=UPI0013D723DD|nr:O-antigen ligase family protein [Cyclobacterium sp. SYSU L10401]